MRKRQRWITKSLLTLTLLLTPAIAAPLIISEFVAVNEGGLQDEDFDSPDWIEIYNPNPTPRDLKGHALSDDPDNLLQWRFPSITLPAQGHLVVFASGIDQKDLPLHNNFQLNEEGESLTLTKPDGKTVLSEYLKFPAQKPHRSYGTSRKGDVVGFFRSPTPGSVNGEIYQGMVEDVLVSVPRGFHDKPFLLDLNTSTPGAAIYFSLDGTAPAPHSGKVYNNRIPVTSIPVTSIPVTSTTVLRVAAHLSGHLPTDVVTHTYIFPEEVKSSRLMSRAITQDDRYASKLTCSLLSLPSISMITHGSTSGEEEIPASMELLFPDGTVGFHVPYGIKEFGGAYTDWRKKSFRLYFRSKYGASKLRYPLFEGHDRDLRAATEFDQLNLRSGSHDMQSRGFYMANRFTADTMLDMGHVAPHGRFVHLYLNGTY